MAHALSDRRCAPEVLRAKILGPKFRMRSVTPEVFACGIASAKCAGILLCARRRHAGEASWQVCAEVLPEKT